jgi:hypothetical protein
MAAGARNRRSADGSHQFFVAHVPTDGTQLTGVSHEDDAGCREYMLDAAGAFAHLDGVQDEVHMRALQHGVFVDDDDIRLLDRPEFPLFVSQGACVPDTGMRNQAWAVRAQVDNLMAAAPVAAACKTTWPSSLSRCVITCKTTRG